MKGCTFFDELCENMVSTICPSWIKEMHDISVARGAEITFGRGVPPISIVVSGSTIFVGLEIRGIVYQAAQNP